jgi:hypothetical protein
MKTRAPTQSLLKYVARSEGAFNYIERRTRRVHVASNFVLGPDIRMQMVCAIADVICQSLRVGRSSFSEAAIQKRPQRTPV